jgi:hypothetical protein
LERSVIRRIGANQVGHTARQNIAEDPETGTKLVRFTRPSTRFGEYPDDPISSSDVMTNIRRRLLLALEPPGQTFS